MASKMFSILAALAVVAAVASGNALEDLDSQIWTGIDKVCQIMPMNPSKDNVLNLRIIEYTTFGYRTHSVFPSAAASLMRSSHFNPKLPTVIFAHGFTDSPLLISGQTFALAYKIHGKFNILAIDSSKLIRVLYFRSSTLVKYIGEFLGVFLYDLRMKGVDMDKVHLVGHSLGAHICGFAGKSYRIVSGGEKLPRITGMDPAGPCFFDTTSDQRLDASDAKFVDIMHTNIGVYGINKTIGTVDFYPNGGGLRQPGCIESICSHNRVWQLYEESVNMPEAFIGTKCDSWQSFESGKCNSNEQAVMGFQTPNTVSGKYYLKTKAFPLFGMGKRGSTS